MKIAVIRCDGDIEILVLNEPIRICDGLSGGQSSIHSAEGMDHFFRPSDGRYDGWGTGMPSPGWSEEQASTAIKAIQEARTVIPVTIRGVLMQRVYKLRQYIVWWYGHITGKSGF